MSQRYLGGVITANPTTPTLASASGVWTLEQQFQYSQTIQPEKIGNSLRFRASATAYMNRTPASAGNLTTWTWSGWVKRGTLGVAGFIFGAGTVSSNDTGLYFETDNTLVYSKRGSINVQTSQVFRDPSAWYHIVVAFDSTQATSSNRLRMYVNGVQVTSFATATYPTASETTQWNNNVASYIGRRGDGVYFDGYLAETYFIDGQALTPSSFGAFDSTGVWQPLTYTGTYGTNGFYLDYGNTTSTTTLGYDTSGNGNNWTTNNFSLTAGVTYDSMIDSPSNYADGGNGRGNYCVLNPLKNASSVVDGNLKTIATTTSWQGVVGSIGVSSGKWYWEVTKIGTDYSMIGIANDLYSTAEQFGAPSNSYTYFSSSGNKYGSGTNAAYGATYTNNDVIGVALDLDGGTLTFYKNNASQGTAYSSITGTWFPMLANYTSGVGGNANFGQRPFAYTPPTGFVALNTQNIPTATINNGAQYMAATLWTGTGSALTINNGTNTTIGTTFQPDFVWVKGRNLANSDPTVIDSVRGTSTNLRTDSTVAEFSASSVTAFNSNGFTLGTYGDVNTNTYNFVGWNWKAAGSSVSNTSGSITSTVNAGATQGFSVVTYTGNGTNGATIGHGLGVAPSMVIVKNRQTAGLDYGVWHSSLTSGTYYLALNTTASQLSGAGVWNSSGITPTSTTFSVGTWAGTNESGKNLVAYCFAAVAGFSKFGSYTGNGSADGPFVYCGFRPRFILCKRTDAASDWFIMDTSRNTYNTANALLSANTNYTESTYASTNYVDFLSNGFKIRQDNSSGYQNASGGTYIYMVFAENPFNTARAR